jgi:hypothetical protein
LLNLHVVLFLSISGLHHIANAIKFVPDLSDIQDFSPMVEAQNLSEETKAASK